MQPEQINKKVIIIFTLNDTNTQTIFEKFPKPDNWANHTFLDNTYPLAIIYRNNIMAINPHSKDSITLPNNTIIILVNDDIEINNSTGEKLKQMINQADYIYASYHINSQQNHQTFFQDNFDDRCISSISQHHTSGSIFLGLKKIAHSFCEKDNDKKSELFSNGIKEILDSFPDCSLEARLELLHQCLTPKGAGKILNDEFPKNLNREMKKFWDKTLITLNPNLNNNEGYQIFRDWTVEEIIKGLARDNASKKKIDYEDCLDSKYLTALSALRDTLLL